MFLKSKEKTVMVVNSDGSHTLKIVYTETEEEVCFVPSRLRKKVNKTLTKAVFDKEHQNKDG